MFENSMRTTCDLETFGARKYAVGSRSWGFSIWYFIGQNAVVFSNDLPSMSSISGESRANSVGKDHPLCNLWPICSAIAQESPTALLAQQPAKI